MSRLLYIHWQSPKLKHLISTLQLDRHFLEELFESADYIETHELMHGSNLLGDKIMCSLFYEESTRTRLSSESAMLRLGGKVIGTENAKEFSSVAKGETLEDTICVVSNYCDIIVLRHDETGAAERAAKAASVPLINAGDGSGEHPTQALLDVYTIQKCLGHVDNISIAMVGDLKYGRTVKSLSYLLSNYRNVKIYFVSPQELKIPDLIKANLKRKKVVFVETSLLEDVINSVDVMYQTRIQESRFEDKNEYERLRGSYIINRAMVNKMKKDAILLHPLPIKDEIKPEVHDMPQAKYFDPQIQCGLLIRMALLKYFVAS